MTTPAASPREDGGIEEPAVGPDAEAGTIWTTTWAMAPTPTPTAGAASAALSTEAPSSAPRIAGAPAIRPSPTREPRRRALVGQRRDDRQPLGRVVQREPDDQRRAEGELADRVGRADRQPLAEVVQPDPDGDHAPPAAARPAARRRSRGRDARGRGPPPVSARNASAAPSSTSTGPPKAPAGARGQLEALERGVDGEEGQQPDGDREQHPHHAAARRGAAPAGTACRAAPG